MNGLNLSEGWATGIPTIQNELEKNGSPYATIETDEGRTFFLIDVPCHPEFLKKEEVVTTLLQPVSTLYQAWMQAIDEVKKNNSTDTPKRVLTLCINLVSTSYQPLSQPLVEAVEYWRKSDSYGLILELLSILLESTSMKGLLEKSNQKSRVRLAQYYVKPLLELELIEMKYPDNPHHQKQQYVLTEIGRKLLERLKL